MSADSARWFRSGRRAIEKRRDGVTLEASGLSPGMTALAQFLPDASAETSDAYWLSMTRDVQLPTAPALGIVFVRDRLDMAGAIAAGRAWQRLHLAATAESLAAQPLNQPVERADRDTQRSAGRTHTPGRSRHLLRKPAGRRPSSSGSASPTAPPLPVPTSGHRRRARANLGAARKPAWQYSWHGSCFHPRSALDACVSATFGRSSAFWRAIGLRPDRFGFAVGESPTRGADMIQTVMRAALSAALLASPFSQAGGARHLHRRQRSGRVALLRRKRLHRATTYRERAARSNS